jgi:hypothetical protein
VHGRPIRSTAPTQPPADLLPHLRAIRQQQPRALPYTVAIELEGAGVGSFSQAKVSGWLAWIDANPADPAEVHGWDLGEFDDDPPAAA